MTFKQGGVVFLLVVLWMVFMLAVAPDAKSEAVIQSNVRIGHAGYPKGQTRGASLSRAPASLKAVVSSVRRRFGRVTVISVCRPGARIRGTRKRSLHASCQAVDFKVANRWAVARWIRRNHPGIAVIVYKGGRRCHSHLHIQRGNFLISKCG